MSIASQTKLMCIVNMASGCTLEEALFVSIDKWGSISILLGEDNDLVKETIHLFDEVNIFIFQFEENTINQFLNISKHVPYRRVTLNDFKYVC